MYQEVLKYCVKVWGVSTILVLGFLIFLNRSQDVIHLFYFIKDYLTELGILSLIGYFIVVAWFRFKFDGEIFIKGLLTGVLGTLLAIVGYVHFSTTIGQPTLLLLLVSMIIGTWCFKLPMFKVEIDRSGDRRDILDDRKFLS